MQRKNLASKIVSILLAGMMLATTPMTGLAADSDVQVAAEQAELQSVSDAEDAALTGVIEEDAAEEATGAEEEAVTDESTADADAADEDITVDEDIATVDETSADVEQESEEIVLDSTEDLETADLTENLALADQTTPAADATVYVTISVKGEFATAKDGSAMVCKEVTVTDLNQDGVLTYDEALAAAHKAYNSEDGYERTSSFWVTRLWGVNGPTAYFWRNGVALSDVVGNTTTSLVKTGDELYAAIFKDGYPTYSDQYAAFDVSRKSVEVGDELTLTLNTAGGVAAGVQVGTWNAGSFTALEGKTTDANGQITLSFNNPGTYLVTAQGTVRATVQDWSQSGAYVTKDCPITAPACIVTVSATNHVKVTFSLLGDSKHNSDTDGKVHTLAGNNLTTWVPATTYYVSPGATVYDVMKMAAEQYDFTMDGNDNNQFHTIYIKGITWNGATLKEFDNGKKTGWRYTVNGIHPNVGVSAKKVADGDTIVFHYTDDYSKEQHTHVWSDWITTTAATVFKPSVENHSCYICGITETRNGSKLTPVLQLPGKLSSFNIKKSQTVKCNITMANGDSIASVKSNNTKALKVVSWKANGQITLKGVKAGKAKLTITLASGKKATYTAKVVTGTVKTSSVSVTNVTNKKLTLAKGKKHTLTVERKPFSSTQKVTYASSNKKVATVSSKGVITAKKAGSAKITVKSGSKKVVVTVTVPKTKTTAITVKTSVTVKKGKTFALGAKKTPANSDEKITYTSANKKIATVTSAGKIKGVKKGTTTITVKSGSVTKKVTVTVK